MQRALELAFKKGFAPRIVRKLEQHGMPSQFLYLAMQESNFNTRICGPETRFGIAKGMWQFIPVTAEKYGLSVGPRVDSPEYDPQDERHDFEKSTDAAARYLQDLYETEAQGSGLLVMACYNWGENKVLDLVVKMPENPRDRNFWNLIKEYRIPEETYDYVFYIIAAAVIGENPRLFGFDFDPPLSPEALDVAAGPEKAVSDSADTADVAAPPPARQLSPETAAPPTSPIPVEMQGTDSTSESETAPRQPSVADSLRGRP
jgi:membrane-bound lytic murein transglycosylase D